MNRFGAIPDLNFALKFKAKKTAMKYLSLPLQRRLRSQVEHICKLETMRSLNCFNLLIVEHLREQMTST